MQSWHHREERHRTFPLWPFLGGCWLFAFLVDFFFPFIDSDSGWFLGVGTVLFLVWWFRFFDVLNEGRRCGWLESRRALRGLGIEAALVILWFGISVLDATFALRFRLVRPAFESVVAGKTVRWMPCFLVQQTYPKEGCTFVMTEQNTGRERGYVFCPTGEQPEQRKESGYTSYQPIDRSWFQYEHVFDGD